MIKAIIFDFFGVLEIQLQPNKELLEYIRDVLKPKYKLGIISNAAGDYVYELLPRTDLDLFDDIIISHRAGVAKPESAIYELSLANLKVRADGVVFIDDVEAYCKAAEGIGIKSVWFENFKQMKSELDRVLAADSDDQAFLQPTGLD